MWSRVRAAVIRLEELFRRRSRFDAELSEEFAFHLDMETAENVRRGMRRADARRAALLRFGGTRRFREETSDARGIAALDDLARDTRFALRRLMRARGFTAGVIATLGIGLGAAAGIGTIVYDVLLRDLPYDKPNQLVRVGFVTEGIAAGGDLQSAATYIHFAKSARSFSSLGAYWTSDDFNLTDGDAPERVTVAFMTPSTFGVLGARALGGQLFEPGDTSWSNPRSAILISERLWRRRYGSDSSIVGRRIDINRGSRIVIGVLPRSFQFPTASVDVYYPAALSVRRPDIAVRSFNVVGRLRDRTSPSAAEAELNSLIPALADRFPAITTVILRRNRARATVTSLKSASVAPVRAQLVLVGVLVAIVLLIATTNVVNLFLLRADRTGQEVAIALSLGATRADVARRFVVEGIVLGAGSAIVAIPVAAVALSTRFGFTEREIPRLHEVSFTPQTLALVFLCAAVIGGGLGLIALIGTASANAFDRLRDARATSRPGWRRAQDSLVAFQVALALVLLVASGLLGRSLWNLRNAKIGFDPRHAMTFQVSLPWDGYTSYAQHAAFHAKLADRLKALPGVASVGVALRLPLASRGTPTLDVQMQADNETSRPVVAAAGNMASADYFHTMGIPLLAGRSFRAGDLRGSPAVVVSERLATSLFGTTDVVGRGIRRLLRGEAGATNMFTIVGVVGDVQWERIEDGYVPTIYFPLLRDGDGITSDRSLVPYEPRDVQFALRGTTLPPAMTIQGIVKELDRRVPAAGLRTLGSLVDDATARVRLTMLLIAVAGTAALLLGVVGVYSVVSYAANGRLREFGIRLALGAAPARIGGMVLGDGLRLVGVGTVAGLIVAFGIARFLRALLYEVKPTSLAEFGSATALLLAVTLFATLLPARRAARTHPGVVLRGE
ncbi:MAG TPA: ADOP family duplicated permease [Gemmatimonadaceae bacterium]|jgi:predicted permease|nr:ADOP family duplicated permease [Gemmatimonadaceae bacterium]